jgi:CRISPR/Cas system-associated endonuclease Cas1
MAYNDEDFLSIAGIQHYVFCPRQWALIHIEQKWSDNLRTVSGNIFHENAHNGAERELRGDTLTTRGLPVFSRTLGMNGRFLGRFNGEINGNVTLRKQQYRISDDEEKSLEIAKSFIVGKLFNSRWVIERTARDYALRVDCEKLKRASKLLNEAIHQVGGCTTANQLRGIEGEGASVYFGVLDDMILQQKEYFRFDGRTKRPPLDAVTMSDEARSALLTAWQLRKKETIKHPFTGEKMQWGIVPLVQAQLLARYIRGDLDAYPPFLWK